MADKPAPAPALAKPSASTTAEEMAHAEQLLQGAPQGATAAEAHGHDEKPAAAHGGAAHAKAKSGKISFFGRFKASWVGACAQIADIFRSLWSHDRPTRRASLFFFVSLGILLALSVLTVQRSIQQKHQRLAKEAQDREEAQERSHEAELLGKSEAPAEHSSASALLSLGQFTVEIKERANQPRTGGFMNMAEIELVVECDSKETKTYLEENLVQARNQMTDIFLSIDRDELLSREGKRKLKKLLIERLNGWIPRGKVQNAFFSKLVVA